jgi:hypothetical protein
VTNIADVKSATENIDPSDRTKLTARRVAAAPPHTVENASLRVLEASVGDASGSFRKRTFSSTKTVACKQGNTPVLVQDRQWPHLYRIHWPDGVISGPANLTRCRDAIRSFQP